MKNLYCVPPGYSMKKQFYNEIDNFGQKKGKTLFILPNLYLINKTKKDIVNYNLEVGSFSFLIDHILSFNSKKATVISSFTQEVIIKSFLDSLEEINKLNYFRGLSNSRGLVKAIIDFINDLTQSMTSSNSFEMALSIFSENNEIREKDKEFLVIYDVYTKFLKENNIFDENTVFLKALEVLEKEDIELPWSDIYIANFYAFNAIEKEIIKALSKKCNIKIELVYQKGNNNIFEVTEKTFEDLVGIGFKDIFPECVLNRNEEIEYLTNNIYRDIETKELSGDFLKIKKFANRRQEMQEVVADIKKHILDGVKPKDIAVIVRNISNYPGMRREFILSGVPVALPEILSFSLQPLVKLILNFVSLNLGDFRQNLRRFFSSYFLKECFSLPIDKIKQILIENYYNSFDEGFFILKNKFIDDKDVSDKLETLYRFCSVFPKKATVVEYNKKVDEFLDILDIIGNSGYSYKNNSIDFDNLKNILKTYEMLKESLITLGESYVLAGEKKKEIATQEYFLLLEKTFQNMQLIKEQGDDEGVHVTIAAEISGKEFEYIYIMGLKEGEFPFFEQEPWLYNFREKSLLYEHGFLDSVNNSLAYDRFLFISSLAAAKNGLYLSVSLKDNELISSHLDEVIRFVPKLHKEKRLANEMLPKEEHIANKNVLASFLVIKDDLNLDEKNWLTNYLGCDFFYRQNTELPERNSIYAGYILDSRIKTKINSFFKNEFTPTSLESYAFCPFKFLLEYIWLLKDNRSKIDDFDYRTKGSIYHECLKAFLNNYKNEDLREYNKENLKEELKNIFYKITNDYHDKKYFNKTKLTDIQLKEMEEKLLFWLDAELEYQKEGFYPCALEKQFGNNSLCEDKNLFFETNKGNFSIKGRIDRIDSNGQEYFITDYKLKNVPAKNEILKGIDLQIPIYLLAAEKTLPGDILGGGYFSIENAKRSGGFWLNKTKDRLSFIGNLFAEQKNMENDWIEYKKIFVQNIESIIENILDGNFPPNPKDICPDYCLGKSICRVNLTKKQGDDNV